MVAGVPCFSEPRRIQVPVGTDLARHFAQIVPEVDDGWTTPEPVAVVDAVDDEAGLQDQRVRNHRIVLGICVLLNVEVFLNLSIRIGQEGPLGADRCAEFLKRVVIVGGDGDDLGVRHGDLWIEQGQFQMLLMFLGAIVAAGEGEDKWVIALQTAELAYRARVVGQFVIGKIASRDNV